MAPKRMGDVGPVKRMGDAPAARKLGDAPPGVAYKKMTDDAPYIQMADPEHDTMGQHTGLARGRYNMPIARAKYGQACVAARGLMGADGAARHGSSQEYTGEHEAGGYIPGYGQDAWGGVGEMRGEVALAAREREDAASGATGYLRSGPTQAWGGASGPMTGSALLGLTPNDEYHPDKPMSSVGVPQSEGHSYFQEHDEDRAQMAALNTAYGETDYNTARVQDQITEAAVEEYAWVDDQEHDDPKGGGCCPCCG
mmetsp:Transcript_21760/g.54864  ORF Transcript_21760/g.54864 Transcript_21760/m.54864 type:complete len:254 (-) Transcript_21760:391-1152(-)